MFSFSDGEESAWMLENLDPWVRKFPWRRKWQLTPVFLPGEYHGQRSLAGYSSWGHKESDTTEWPTLSLSRSRKATCFGHSLESHIFMSSSIYENNFFLLLICLMSVELLDQPKMLLERKGDVFLPYTINKKVFLKYVGTYLFPYPSGPFRTDACCHGNRNESKWEFLSALYAFVQEEGWGWTEMWT